MDDSAAGVDVTTLQPDPFLRSQACEAGEDGDGGEARVQLLGHGLELRDGLERNGRRSPRKLLRAAVARLLGRKPLQRPTARFPDSPASL